MTDIKKIQQSLQDVHLKIRNACAVARRNPATVQLLAVSKRHRVEKIRAAYAAGQTDFGENYLNEALEKQEQLNDLPIQWHFIGHVQSNKTRKIAAHFDWVHTVDSVKVARRLSAQRPDNLSPINICLQINIDNEVSKAGLAPDKAALLTLANDIARLPRLNLRGLMCIPAPKNDSAAERESFARMADLQHFLQANGLSLDTLSMGMSDDLDSAIACGATIVRVGTAIFGARQKITSRDYTT